MGRYNLNRDENIFERIIGWLLGALLIMGALGGMVAAAKWTWHYFFS